MKTARLFLALTLAAAAAFSQAGGAQKSDARQKSDASDTTKSDTKLAPYFPTPETVVDKMLQLGGLKQGEKMFDLGSGDGRIVIMAARKFKAQAVGVELDAALVKLSADKIRTLGLAATAHIVEGDLLEQDYSSADLVTIYLLPVAIEKVTPILDKQLKKGARVVAHDFEFFQWTAAKVVDIDDDGEGRSHRLFLYQR
ncbi:MAG TPA: methyltransferase domain-containing protein [Bryobacteraceae bacterium]|nr:methyltransferase domain-containing protein [Bryobacteraceae bacterium]